jgi:hypothetical protein
MTRNSRLYSRRTALKMLATGAASVLLPGAAGAVSTLPPVDELRRNLSNVIGGLEIGLDLRRINERDGSEIFRIQINADKLYPVASCFKIFVVMYYLWHTPREQWRIDEYSAAYRVAVYSANGLTGTLMDEIDRRITYYGNAVQKYNDFLLFTLELEHGIYSWNWEGSPTDGFSDDRFEASSARSVHVRGLRYLIDNVTTAADLADGYMLLLQPDPFPNADDPDHAAEVVATTLDLFSIPAGGYQSPFERVFPNGYTGKDGVLPHSMSPLGRVINDAGIVRTDGGTYVISFLCAGEGEYVALQVLRQVAAMLDAFDSVTT